MQSLREEHIEVLKHAVLYASSARIKIKGVNEMAKHGTLAIPYLKDVIKANEHDEVLKTYCEAIIDGLRTSTS